MSNFQNIRSQFEQASSGQQTPSPPPPPPQPQQQPQQQQQQQRATPSSRSSPSSATAASSVMDPRDEEIANRYKAQLKQGIPNDAVMKDMVDNSVEPHIMSKVLAYDPGASEREASSPSNNDAEEEGNGDDEDENSRDATEDEEDEDEDENDETSAFLQQPTTAAQPEPSENYDEEDHEVSAIMAGNATGSSSGASSQGSKSSRGSRSSSKSSKSSLSSAAAAAYFGASTVSSDPFGNENDNVHPTVSSDPFADNAIGLQPLGGVGAMGADGNDNDDDELNDILPTADAYRDYEEPARQNAGYSSEETDSDTPQANNLYNADYLDSSDRFDDEGFSNNLYAQGTYNNQQLQQRQQQQASLYGGDPEQARSSSMGKSRYDQEEEEERRKRKALMMWIAIVCCILLLVTIALVVLLFLVLGDDDDNDNNNTSAGRGADLNGTVAPTMSASPTSSPSPTMAPSGSNNIVQLTSVQDISGSSSSQQGTAVQISGNWVAVSSPPLGNGTVVTFLRPQVRADYQLSQVLTGNSVGSEFGADIAFSSVIAANPLMAISAPEEPIEGTNTPAGSVYFYVYKRGDAMWILEGSGMVGGTTPAHSNERFGSSIAISDTYRVVVGAPGYGATDIGRVYTFTFEQLPGTAQHDWVPLSSTQMVGSAANGMLGTSVDITTDGLTFVVGEPGSSSFRIYEWGNGDWSLSYELALPEAEDLGSDVLCLSSNYVAVGAPSANGGAGIIFAFERTNSTWSLLGQIEGTSGQGLGATGTMSGQEGPDGPELVVGTKTGEVMLYTEGGLVRRFRSGSSTPSAPVTNLDISDDGVFSVIVGFGSLSSVTILEEGTGARNNPITDSPTPAPADWQLVTSPSLEFADANTDFGSAVASAGDEVAVGLPRYSSRLGAVQTYERNGNSFTDSELVTNPITEEFGSSIQMAVLSDGSTVGMLVGATDTDGATLVSAFGSAHYYEKTSSSGQWDEIGTELRGGENLVQGGGKLGQSVAMASQLRRIAVASPSSSVNGTILDTGRVFTYEYDNDRSDWVEMVAPLIGEVDDFMGTGLDMSADGSRLLVGSPGVGTEGNVQYFTWASGSWFQFESEQGSGSGEMLGTTAVILNSAGTQFAAGGPGFQSNRGVIRVFSQNTPNGPFSPRGSPIIGEADEEIGQTLCGENGRIAFGTALGGFRVYEFSNGDWQQIGTSQSTGSSPVVSIAMNGDTVYVGLQDEQVLAYEFAQT